MAKKVKYEPENRDLPMFQKRNEVLEDIIDEAGNRIKLIISHEIYRAYNRGFEAGCVKAQQQIYGGDEKWKKESLM